MNEYQVKLMIKESRMICKIEIEWIWSLIRREILPQLPQTYEVLILMSSDEKKLYESYL